MESPLSRLPDIRVGDWFEDFPTRTFLLYGLYTLALFLVFLVFNFPYRVLVDRLVRQVDLSPAEVTIGDASLAVTRGLELRGVSVRRPDLSRLPVLEVPRAHIWPGVSGLLSGQISKASVKGDLYGGRLKARWRGRDVQKVEVQLSDLQVSRYPVLSELLEAGQIYGLLSAYVEHEGRVGDADGGRASGEVYLDQAGSEDLVVNGLPILDLSFEEIKVLFSLQGGRAEVEEISAIGPDILMSGSGQIGVREPFSDSVLDLQLTIQAVEDARPEVKGLVSLIPRKRGASDKPVTLSGTIRSPRFK